jgi:hypothetical protein
VADGLVVLYPFDEGTGTVVHDRSGRGTPLDLEIEDPARISWLPGSNGVEFHTAGSAVRSPGAATKLADYLTFTHRITIEAWALPSNLTQMGPARIVTYSGGTWSTQMNFHLGQGGGPGSDGRHASFRLRTNLDYFTWLDVSEVFTDTVNPVHLVATWDGSVKRLYVNGMERSTVEFIGGSFSTWVTSWPFAIGNEVTLDRSWLGKVYLVAVYDRALQPGEVQQNHAAGWQASSGKMAPEGETPSDPGSEPLEEGFASRDRMVDPVPEAGSGVDEVSG